MSGELEPGDEVVVTIGRHRGSKGVVLSVDMVPTPTGGRVSMVTFRRPRAGETCLFTSDVRLAGAANPEKRPIPAGFGS